MAGLKATNLGQHAPSLGANRWVHNMSVRVYYIVFLSLIYFDESSDVRCFVVTFESLRKRYVSSPEKNS